MNKIIKLFLLLCLPGRLIIAYFGEKVLKTNYKYYYAILTLLIGISFLYQYLSNYRKLGAFSQKVWWSNYRILHAFNYLFYSYLILLPNKLTKYSYLTLYLDAFLGLFLFILNKVK